MKITKKQLRRIIREELLRETDDMSKYDDITKVPLNLPPRPDKLTPFRSQADRDGEYNLGREDSFAGMRPQSSGKDYMRGYNEAQMDAGLPRMQAPSDSGRGKKLDPSKLKGAFAGKYYGQRGAGQGGMLRVGDLDKEPRRGMLGQPLKKRKKFGQIMKLK